MGEHVAVKCGCQSDLESSAPKGATQPFISKMKNCSFSCLRPKKAFIVHAATRNHPCCSGGHASVCGPRTTSLALLGCHKPSKCPWSVFPRRPYGYPWSVPLLDAMLMSVVHGRLQRPYWYPRCVLPPETMLMFMLLINAGRNVCPRPGMLAETMFKSLVRSATEGRDGVCGPCQCP